MQNSAQWAPYGIVARPAGEVASANSTSIVTAAPPESATLADVVTLVGYGLGVWWAVGGPTWAGVASIVADEVDGRLARAMGTSSAHGAALDWGGDIALTPLALMRLGKEIGHEKATLATAPGVLFVQAQMRANDVRPSIGSARAAIMAAAMIAHEMKEKKR